MLPQPRRLGKGGLPQATTRVRHGLAPARGYCTGCCDGALGPARPVIAQPRRIGTPGPSQCISPSCAGALGAPAALLWHYRFAMMQNAKCSLTRDHRCGPARALPQVPSECAVHAPTPEGGINEIPSALAHPCAPHRSGLLEVRMPPQLSLIETSAPCGIWNDLGETEWQFSSGPLPFTARDRGPGSPRHLPGSSDRIEIHQRRSTPRPGSFHRREIAGSLPIRSASQHVA